MEKNHEKKTYPDSFGINSGAFPVMAQEDHHAAAADTSATAAVNTEKLDASMTQMKDMRQKMMTTTDKKTRKKLMGKNMQMMKNCMQMMSGMGMMNQGKMMGQGNQGKMMKQGQMMGKQNTEKLPMADRVSMMEKKMAMMNNMMSQAGMMDGQGMMNCMSAKTNNDRVQLLEKKIQVMQEMMNGMLAQQELMMQGDR